jgi:hypothetical protein
MIVLVSLLKSCMANGGRKALIWYQRLKSGCGNPLLRLRFCRAADLSHYAD